jgi:L-arabinose transport system substrate-binding protein
MKFTRGKALTTLVAAGMVFTACSSDDKPSPAAVEETVAPVKDTATSVTETAPPATTGPAVKKKVFYIAKRLDQGWFQNEAKGVEKESGAVGLDLTVLDSRFDASVEQSHIDTAVSQGAGGVILVIQDQKRGPAVLTQASAAGISVIAVDDPIVDSKGVAAPFVGMATTEIGKDVGTLLVEAATERKWSAADIGVAGLTFNEVSVCTERTDATKAAIQSGLSGIPAGQFLESNYAAANTDGGLTAMQGLITANPNIKHWLVYSCNEEGVVGAVRALEAAGLDADSCGVGLGDGALALIEFKKGSKAYCGSLFADSALHGKTAASLMADHLLNGKPLPLETLVPGVKVTPTNYQEVLGK